VKLRVPDVVVLFLLGAVAGLIGDHSHVVTGATVYYTDAVPYIWSSPFWFPIMVGGATLALAELRLHLPAPRTTVSARQCFGGIAAVVGTYVVTALMHTGAVVPVTALIVTLAVVTWCVLGDGPAVVCGALAAVIGPIVEIVLVAIGVFAYHADSSHLFGVALFLVPLYFAFGVVAASLGEFAAARSLANAGPSTGH
jgi:hypothetical protein